MSHYPNQSFPHAASLGALSAVSALLAQQSQAAQAQAQAQAQAHAHAHAQQPPPRGAAKRKSNSSFAPVAGAVVSSMTGMPGGPPVSLVAGLPPGLPAVSMAAGMASGLAMNLSASSPSPSSSPLISSSSTALSPGVHGMPVAPGTPNSKAGKRSDQCQIQTDSVPWADAMGATKTTKVCRQRELKPFHFGKELDFKRFGSCLFVRRG